MACPLPGMESQRIRPPLGALCPFSADLWPLVPGPTGLLYVLEDEDPHPASAGCCHLAPALLCPRLSATGRLRDGLGWGPALWV